MKLFYLPGACSLAPHILLNELKIPYELEKMNKADKSSILRYNPKGYVPTLVIDEKTVLTEVAVILQYLADLKPESGFIPKFGSWERYKCMEWLNFVSSEIHKKIGILFTPEFKDDARAILKDNANKRLEYLDQHFSKNDYLMGKQCTVPDLYAFVTASWTKYVGIDLEKFENLRAFMERIKNRPATQAAMAAEAEKKS